MDTHGKQHRAILQEIAHRVMLERGLLPDFSPAVMDEVDRMQLPDLPKEPGEIQDLQTLLWASIDNDDSRDLDQLTVAESLSQGNVKILVAIADVDGLVQMGTATDKHARHNTTSVYTAAEIFPMLPEKLSTGLTSLNFNETRLAIIIEMIFNSKGVLQDSSIYRAYVRNHAKLAYNSVAAWLEGNGPMPEGIAAVKGLAENLQLQDQLAQKLKELRHINGALSLETIEARPVFDGDAIRELAKLEKNRATEIIEDFMIAANGVTARYLAERKYPSLRRVVRTPRRWDRIVELAAERKYELPSQPDSVELQKFLLQEKANDPVRFPDLSLAVIKLLGSGEYVAEFPGETAPGHFGLAVKDYSHSTAPNRRYPDLVTQRLVKAALSKQPIPFSFEELEFLARHCTEEEDIVNKVERQVDKSAAALLLENRIGEEFNGVVTGASEKGTWVRLFKVPVEGKLVQGMEGVDVGDRVRAELISVDVERGYLDFRKVGPASH
jgi:exoribonuclease-2